MKVTLAIKANVHPDVVAGLDDDDSPEALIHFARWLVSQTENCGEVELKITKQRMVKLVPRPRTSQASMWERVINDIDDDGLLEREAQA